MNSLAPGVIGQQECYFCKPVLCKIIPDFCRNLQICGLRRSILCIFDFSGPAGQSAKGGIQLRHMNKRHAAEQSRSGIPSGIRLHAWIHGNHDRILFARIHQLGNICLKG